MLVDVNRNDIGIDDIVEINHYIEALFIDGRNVEIIHILIEKKRWSKNCE